MRIALSRLVSALILLCVITGAASAQTLTWKPIGGTYRAVGAVTLTRDSVLTNGSYLLLTPNAEWTPAPTPFAPLKPKGGFTITNFGDTTFGAVHDTLLVSYDSGRTYSIVKILGVGTTSFVSSLVRTTSGLYVVGSSAGAVFTSKDNFHLTDSATLPEFTGGFPTFTLDNDTLLWISSHNNIYRSTNLGKTWVQLIHFSGEKQPGQTVVIAVHDGRYYVTENIHNAVLKKDSNAMVEFSLDRGANWTLMSIPTPTSVPNDLVIVGSQIFLIFRDNLDTALFRTIDFGHSWQRIQSNVTIKSLFADKMGILYVRSKTSGLYLRSRDGGTTWELLPNGGMISTITSLVTIGDTTFETSTDSLYASTDHGLTWNNRSGWTGRLGAGYNNALTIDGTFTTKDGGRSFALLGGSTTPTGPGLVSKNGKLWVIAISGAGPFGQAYAYQTLDSGATWGSPMFLSNDTIRSYVESRDTSLIVASRLDLLKGQSAITNFENISPEALWPVTAKPSGALAKDSLGSLFVAMQDGKMFSSNDNARSWSLFPSPSTDSTTQITEIVAGPRPNLFVIDSNTKTNATNVLQFNYKDSTWNNITATLTRPGYQSAPRISGLYYSGKYLWATTQNLSLFRSSDTLAVETAAHGSVSLAELQHLNAYPNPALDHVHISFPISDVASVKLLNELGEMSYVLEVKPGAQTADLQLKNLRNGTYMLICDSPHGRYTGRIVVDH